MSILRALNNKDIISSSSEVLSRNSPVSSPSSPQQRKVPQLSVENPDLPTTATALAALRPTNFNHKIEDHIRELPVVNIAPVAHYQVTHLTLYDYELPPGLITINEAKSLIELYRRGGRLVARSVHKILRLAYKLLKESRNITDVTVTEQDKLIVVGDIHGKGSISVGNVILTFSSQDNSPTCCTSWSPRACPRPTTSTSSTATSWIEVNGV